MKKKINWDTVLVLKDVEEYRKSLKRYLVSLTSFYCDNKTFNHPTILVRARDEQEARQTALRLSPSSMYTGKIKEVDY